MRYLSLLLVGSLWLSSAFASEAGYVCTEESTESSLLGESFVLVPGEDRVVLTSEDIGVCLSEDGELSGDSCEVEGEVSIELDDNLIDGADEGYLSSTTDEDEAVYSCVSGRE